MHVVEFEISGLPWTSNQIDDNIWIFDSLTNRILVVQMIKVEQNLTEIAGWFQSHRRIEVAAIATHHLWADLAEPIGDVLSQEASRTEYSDDHAIETGSAASASFHRRQIGRLQFPRCVGIAIRVGRSRCNISVCTAYQQQSQSAGLLFYEY